MVQTLGRWRQYFREIETIYWYHFVTQTPSFMTSDKSCAGYKNKAFVENVWAAVDKEIGF